MGGQPPGQHQASWGVFQLSKFSGKPRAKQLGLRQKKSSVGTRPAISLPVPLPIGRLLYLRTVCLYRYCACEIMKFYLIFTCVDPDPYSDYESGSTKSLNMDPIRIRIHNTGTNRILIFSVGTGTGTSLLNSCEFSTGIILANSRHIISQQYSPPMRNIFAESCLEWKNIAINNI